MFLLSTKLLLSTLHLHHLILQMISLLSLYILFQPNHIIGLLLSMFLFPFLFQSLFQYLVFSKQFRILNINLLCIVLSDHLDFIYQLLNVHFVLFQLIIIILYFYSLLLLFQSIHLIPITHNNLIQSIIVSLHLLNISNHHTIDLLYLLILLILTIQPLLSILPHNLINI